MYDRLFGQCCALLAVQFAAFLPPAVTSYMTLSPVAANENKANLSALWLMEIPSVIRASGRSILFTSELMSSRDSIALDAGTPDPAASILK